MCPSLIFFFFFCSPSSKPHSQVPPHPSLLPLHCSCVTYYICLLGIQCVRLGILSLPLWNKMAKYFKVIKKKNPVSFYFNCLYRYCERQSTFRSYHTQNCRSARYHTSSLSLISDKNRVLESAKKSHFIFLAVLCKH